MRLLTESSGAIGTRKILHTDTQSASSSGDYYQKIPMSPKYLRIIGNHLNLLPHPHLQRRRQIQIMHRQVHHSLVERETALVSVH